MVKLTRNQIETLRVVDEASGKDRTSFALHLSLNALTNLWKLGLVAANGKVHTLPQTRLPRTAIHWTTTQKGIDVLVDLAKRDLLFCETKQGVLKRHGGETEREEAGA